MLFIDLSVALFFFIILLMFIKPSFNTTVAAFILCFIEIVLSFIAGLGFFSIDFLSYDSTGALISNPIMEYDFLGYIFFGLSYLSLVFLLYCIYMFYEKPWSGVKKIEENPYA